MPLALAVSIKLYKFALAVAPDWLAENSQFFLPTTNGRIAFSAALLSTVARHYRPAPE